MATGGAAKDLPRGRFFVLLFHKEKDLCVPLEYVIFCERFWQWLVRLFSFIVMELIWRGFAPPSLPTQGESPL